MARRWFRLAFAGFLAAAFIVGCRVTDLPLWDAPKSKTNDSYEVREMLGVAYFDGPGADRVRHRLDLFVPKGAKDCPVVVFVHGGAWVVGDNRCCGLYSSVGKHLASRGIAVAMTNYRLSPDVKHPEHIKDVARAVAWTKANIAQYGGSPNELFLMGHSAGGHLVSLLATDEQYLNAVGLKADEIRGVISVSGVYRITPGNLSVTLGGEGPLAFRLDKMSPLRGDNMPKWAHLGGGTGIPLDINVFGPAFGDDPKVRESASPINHVRPGLPPFLIFSADNDLPVLNDMARDFDSALRNAVADDDKSVALAGETNRTSDSTEMPRGHSASHWVRVQNRNHNSIIFSAIERNDPVAQRSFEFIRSICHPEHERSAQSQPFSLK